MKKKVLTFAAGIIIAITTIIGCQTKTEKVENAEVDLQEANQKVLEASHELDKAINDSIQQFREESNDKIIAHEKSISEFKARIAKDKKINRAKYLRELKELEQKNSDMKKKLDEYKATGKENWEAFKIEFMHDLDEFGKAFKNLSVKNVK